MSSVLAETRPLRILVVDDEPAMVGAVSALVGSAGHQVVTAYDGDTALRRLSEEGPDLILLDLAMPGRDGVDVCREVRRTSTVPIIVLTGETDELAKVAALDAGADDYVTKPFGRQELLARIRAVMRRRAAGAAEAGAGELRVGSLGIDLARFRATVDGVPLSLTRIEFALLAALVDARGAGRQPRPAARRGLAARNRSRSAVAQAAPRPAANEARGRRRPAARLGSRRGLPPGRRLTRDPRASVAAGPSAGMQAAYNLFMVQLLHLHPQFMQAILRRCITERTPAGSSASASGPATRQLPSGLRANEDRPGHSGRRFGGRSTIG